MNGEPVQLDIGAVFFAVALLMMARLADHGHDDAKMLAELVAWLAATALIMMSP